MYLGRRGGEEINNHRLRVIYVLVEEIYLEMRVGRVEYNCMAGNRFDRRYGPMDKYEKKKYLTPIHDISQLLKYMYLQYIDLQVLFPIHRSQLASLSSSISGDTSFLPAIQLSLKL